MQSAILSNNQYYEDSELPSDDYEFLDSNYPYLSAFISMNNITLQDAMESSDWPQWQQAMQDELTKLDSINTWNIVNELPPGRKPLH